MAFGLNEPSNVVGDILPLLYFSQTLEQTKLRQDQMASESARAQEAMELRQREEARQQEAFTLSKGELAVKVLPDLPPEEQEQLYNEVIRKPFGLSTVTGEQVQQDMQEVHAFRDAIKTEQDPTRKVQGFRDLVGRLRSRRARAEASTIGAEIEGQAAAEAIIPIRENAPPEERASGQVKRNFVAMMPRKEQSELFKSIMTSKTVDDNNDMNRVLDIRNEFDAGHITPELLNEEAIKSGRLGLPAYDPLTSSYRQAKGRVLAAQNFQLGFTDGLQQMERGLVPLQQVQERGSLKSLDAIDQAIGRLESRGIEDLSLTETYDLQHLKDQRASLHKSVFQSLGINAEQRDTAVEQMRQRVAVLDRAVLNLKKQKGVPGAESQQHAMEAMSEAYKAQIQALTNPSSEAVSKLVKSKERMTSELDFWGQEQQKAEKDIAKLTKARLKSGTDQQLRAQAEKEAAAQAQIEFAAKPKAQQTSQSAGAIAKRLTDETGVPVQVDDVLKAGKDPNAPLLKLDMKQESSEAQVVGKGFGEQYVKIQDAGTDAFSKIARLERMEGLLQGVETGKLTPAMTEVAAVGESLGIKVDKDLPAKQALKALTNEVALQLRNPSGGAGMPGAMSDKDREFLMSMTPGLANTPEGNRTIIETAKTLAKRDQEVALMARQYRKKHGHLDEGFYDDLAEYSAKHPLFKDKKVPVVSEASAYSEIRVTPDGRRLGKKADGTIEVIK